MLDLNKVGLCFYLKGFFVPLLCLHNPLLQACPLCTFCVWALDLETTSWLGSFPFVLCSGCPSQSSYANSCSDKVLLLLLVCHRKRSPEVVVVVAAF